MITLLRRALFSRKLTDAEREVFDAACRFARARADHNRSKGLADELEIAWKRLNGLRREARISGLFEKATAP